MRTDVLLFIHTSRVSRCERDNLIAGSLLVISYPVGPDEGVQVSVDCGSWLGAVF